MRKYRLTKKTYPVDSIRFEVQVFKSSWLFGDRWETLTYRGEDGFERYARFNDYDKAKAVYDMMLSDTNKEIVLFQSEE